MTEADGYVEIDEDISIHIPHARDDNGYGSLKGWW